MSKAKTVAKSSGGGLSLTFVVGSIVAWCKTPTFFGWAGVGKSLLTGLGTSIASTIGTIAGVIGGGLGLGLLGLCIGGKKGGVVGGIAGAILGGLGGYGVGAYEGYTNVKGWLVEKDKAVVTTAFNDNAAKVMNSEKTLVLDAKAFAKPAVKTYSMAA